MTFAKALSEVAERLADSNKQDIIDALFVILDDRFNAGEVAEKIADEVDIVEEVAQYIMDS